MDKAKKHDKNNLRWGFLALFIGLFMYLTFERQLFNQEHIVEIFTNTELFEISIGLVIFTVVLLVFFVPISWISVGATILLGYKSIYLVMISRILASVVSFSIGRLFKEDVSKVLEKYYYSKREDTLVEAYERIKKKDFGKLLFFRIIPAVPFNLSNYLFALSYMEWSKHLLLTALSLFLAQGVNIYLVYNLLDIENDPIGATMAALVKVGYIAVIFLIANRKKLGRYKIRKT